MRLRPRYFVALLWHWSIPFALGAVTASVVQLSVFTEVVPDIEQAFIRSIQSACSQPGQPAQISPL